MVDGKNYFKKENSPSESPFVFRLLHKNGFDYLLLYVFIVLGFVSIFLFFFLFFLILFSYFYSIESCPLNKCQLFQLISSSLLYSSVAIFFSIICHFSFFYLLSILSGFCPHIIIVLLASLTSFSKITSVVKISKNYQNNFYFHFVVFLENFFLS